MEIPKGWVVEEIHPLIISRDGLYKILDMEGKRFIFLAAFNFIAVPGCH